MKTEFLPRHANTRLITCLPIVCQFWNVDSKDVLGLSRKREFMNARHSLRYFLSTFGDLTLSDVATLTNCDHSNVVHSVKTFKILCEYDEDFRSFKRRILKEVIRQDDYTLNGKLRRIIKSTSSVKKKVDLIKKVFENENK
jgi:chromosomal replication initiation ATPase DnaA